MVAIKLHDVVALTEDVRAPKLLQDGELLLRRGLVGTVVEILSAEKAYEVEFAWDSNGEAYAMTAIEPEKLLVLRNESEDLETVPIQAIAV